MLRIDIDTFKNCFLVLVAYFFTLVLVAFLPTNVSAQQIIPHAFRINGLTDHKVIDSATMAIHQGALVLDNKVQTIKLLDPALKQHMASLRIHICERNIEPNTGSCTTQPFGAMIPITSDTFIFAVMPKQGKAGVEHHLYLSHVGNLSQIRYYREINNQSFIYPQDQYQLVFEEQKLDKRNTAGFHVEAGTRKIKFNITDKGNVLPMLKADKLVTRFGAALYTPDGKHIQKLNVIRDPSDQEFPYSITISSNQYAYEIPMSEGSYLLHIDFPYTSIPLDLSLVPFRQGQGGGFIYAPNGFIVPVNFWGKSTVSAKLMGNTFNLNQSSFQSFKDNFYIRKMNGGGLSYHLNSSLIFDSRYFTTHYKETLQESCDRYLSQSQAVSLEDMPTSERTLITNFKVAFSGVTRKDSEKPNFQESPTNIVTYTRLSGTHNLNFDVTCSYHFSAEHIDENEESTFTSHRGLVSAPLTLRLIHNNMAAK